MADIRKFLDAAGVSALWGEVVTEVEAKVAAQAAADATVYATIANLNAANEKIATLETNAYDDTAVRGLIAGNTAAIALKADQTALNALDGKVGVVAEGKTVVQMIADAQTAATYDDTEVRGLITDNADAIAVLNSEASVAGSVANTAAAIAAAKVAEVVASADAKFDTLKEIADWILNDSTGAADMANDIAALQGLVGDVAVATQIANAIAVALKVEGVDKYALASDLTTLAGRVKALEDAGYQNASQVSSAIDTKIAALNLAESYDAKGAAASAETAAKSYADGLAKNYATAAQGAKADSAVQSVTSGSTNGTIAVDGTEVAVKGLGSAAYVNTSTFDAAGSAAQALSDAKAYANGLAGNYDATGSAAQALVDAKAYTDALDTNIKALSADEIKAAITAASN